MPSDTYTLTISDAGVSTPSTGSVVNASVAANAAIAFSKLATLTSGNILVGSSGNVPTSVAVTGDVTISNTGVTSLRTSPTLVTPGIGVATGTSLAVTGAITSSGTAGIGYEDGSGGLATQGSSKVNPVTINKTNGQITMDDAALAQYAVATFTLVNSTIAVGDVLILNHVSGGTAGKYLLNAQCLAGSANINVTNVTTGSASEAIVIAFVVIKADTTAISPP